MPGNSVMIEFTAKRIHRRGRGGNNTAVLKVHAEVCLRCGECLSSQETIRKFEEIRVKPEHQDTADFQPLGKSFQVI